MTDFRAALAAPLALIIVLLVGASPPAAAAIKFLRELPLDGRFAPEHPFGVAVDRSGEVYIADTQHHRILKYTKRELRAFGRFGSVRGQLAYPAAVAVDNRGFLPRTLVYVADTGNSRIVVYDDDGKFRFSFGSLGSGDGQLDHPNGIAIPPNRRSIVVTEERNNRVSEFTLQGEWLHSWYCTTCPDHQFHVPAGIAVHSSRDDSEYYVTDTFGGQVHVLDELGNWVRSIGSSGRNPGQLYFPDEIAVDDDGSAWVAESSDTNRVSKFAPDGKFLYSFSHGGTAFGSPHGAALGPDGTLYVANTNESVVQEFAEVDPKIQAVLYEQRKYWLDTSGAWFTVAYNGAEQTCDAKGSARIVVDPDAARPVTFTLTGGPVTIGNSFDDRLKMDMTASQLDAVRRAWHRGKVIRVVANMSARCQDGTRLSTKLTDVQ